MSNVKGYKAFNDDMSCTHGKGKFQYEIGKTYELSEEVEAGKNGFHFCLYPEDCFKYYPKGSRLCEIRALGIIESDNGLRYTTDKIQIIREIYV